MIMAQSRQQLALVKLATEIDALSYAGTIEQIEATRKHGPLIFKSRSFLSVESLEWQPGSMLDSGWQLATESTTDFFHCLTCDRYVQRTVLEQLAQHPGQLRFAGFLRSEIPIRDIEKLHPSICRAATSQRSCTPITIIATSRAPVEIRPVTAARVMRAGAMQQLFPRSTPTTGDDPLDMASQNDHPSVRPCPERTIFEQRIEFVYDLPMTGPETHYQIEFSAGPLNLGYPSWVCEYSTRDPKEWQKTLNLEDIVQSIVDASSADDVFLIHSLVLKRSRP